MTAGSKQPSLSCVIIFAGQKDQLGQINMPTQVTRYVQLARASNISFVFESDQPDQMTYSTKDPEIRKLRPRNMLPSQVFANDDFLKRLDAMALAPWEVITSRELANCAEISPQTLADWRWALLGGALLPEPEPDHLYAGKTLHYRVDKLRAWFDGKGRERIDQNALWVQAADHLEGLGLHRPAHGRDVNVLLNFLWSNLVLSLRVVPRREPFLPY
jgi:hypothetical protein